MAGTPLLSLCGVSKRFGAVRALVDVDLEIHAGEIVAVVGENGAGKSTLIKVIAGASPVESGVIEWQGRPVVFRDPHDAQNMGIASVHQDFPLCDNLDVVRNMFLGREIRRFGVINKKSEMEKRSRELMNSLACPIPSVRVPAASLSGGQRQTVAIARSLIGEPKLLILDEPCTALGAQQTAQVLDRIVDLRDRGVGVLLVTHSLDEVRALADRVAVLRLGRNNGFFEVKYTTQEQLVSAISGDHALGVTLQESLLPRGLPDQSAFDVASRYLPAQGGVGGDWFDVIPLPGARAALVVGDVVGHGLHAAATMGRLRTAIHNFSALDLPPNELLTHLDELVIRIDADQASEASLEGVTGATCLYAVYDPASGNCVVACAGHLPPALVHADGTVDFVDLPVGPPLGLGGLPFEVTELHLPEGSKLVLYTDGLIENRERDIDVGLELLRTTLAHPGQTPEETCASVLHALLPDRQSDDIAMLVARTHILAADRIAEWDIPSEPAAVSQVRADVTRRLATWNMPPDVVYATELIVSELVTNAIRHGSPPISLRLLWDRDLTCEVYDGTSTAPHLRYAATTDEGGRGLFLVGQCADRWGTRYPVRGKVIWAELALSA